VSPQVIDEPVYLFARPAVTNAEDAREFPKRIVIMDEMNLHAAAVDIEGDPVTGFRAQCFPHASRYGDLALARKFGDLPFVADSIPYFCQHNVRTVTHDRGRGEFARFLPKALVRIL